MDEIIESIPDDLEENLSLDEFSFITEIPEEITQRDFYIMESRAYNLALLIMFFLVAKWLISLSFGIFKPLYRKEKY